MCSDLYLIKEEMSSLIKYDTNIEGEFLKGQLNCCNQILNLIFDDEIVLSIKNDILKKNKDLEEDLYLFKVILHEVILFNTLKLITKRIKYNKNSLSYPISYYKNNSLNENCTDDDSLKETYIAGKQYYLENLRYFILNKLKQVHKPLNSISV